MSRGQEKQTSASSAVPYWNDACAERSSQLWCPTVIDLQGLGSTSLPSWFSGTAAKSWFSTESWQDHQRQNLPLIYSQSSIISLAACTDKEVVRAKRIRIYPTATQKTIFKKWFGVSRRVYNETVSHLSLPKEEREGHWMGAAKIILKNLPEWADEIPYQVKKIAVKDAYQAFSNGIRKFKKTSAPFKLKFRSRKNPKQSCFIPHSALHERGIYPRLSGDLFRTEAWPENSCDSRLILENGRWFVMVPYRVAATKAENQGRVVALDPGIRTFLTGYSEDQVFKIGPGDFARIARLCHHLDQLVSKIAKARCRQRQRLRKVAQRMRWKIRDLVDELHFQSIRLILDRFDMILLPTFETKMMVSRSCRKIRSKSVRAMLGYAFFRFGQRLESSAKQSGKVVLRVNEAYTSKTASWSGEVKPIGGAKTITSAGKTVDRDVNGARGIFLRALVDTPSLAA